MRKDFFESEQSAKSDLAMKKAQDALLMLRASYIGVAKIEMDNGVVVSPEKMATNVGSKNFLFLDLKERMVHLYEISYNDGWRKRLKSYMLDYVKQFDYENDMVFC